MLIFLVAFLGAFVGAVAERVVEFFFRRIERRESYIDAHSKIVVDSILETKQQGSRYWASEFDPKSTIANEAKLSGSLEFIPEMYSEIFLNNSNVKMMCDVRFNKFKRSIQGGNFGVKGRPAEPNKLAEIEISAQRLMSYISIERSRLKPKLFKS